MRPAFRSWLKKSIGPLLWLAGLAMIMVYAPARYQILQLDKGEQVVAFLGKGHELITLGGVKPLTDDQLPWLQLVGRMLRLVPGLYTVDDSWLSKAGPIYVRDLDRGTRRSVALGDITEIYGLSPCADGSRLCVEHGGDTRFLSIVDAMTGKTIRTLLLKDGQWSISSDGRTVVLNDFNDDRRRLKCVDVDKGRLLYTTVLGQDRGGFLSPDGKYIAITCMATARTLNMSDLPVGYVIDVVRKQKVGEIRPGCPTNFSPDSHRLLDTNHNVWDILPGGTIQLLNAADESVFANRGKCIASICYENATARVRFRQLDTGEEFSSKAGLPLSDLPGTGLAVSLQAMDDDCNSVRLLTPREDDNRTKLHEILASLGFKQKPRLSYEWQLIDSRTGAIMRQGSETLLAVSRDGRYVVSGDPREARNKVYEIPLRRSLVFIAVAGAFWTALTVTVPWWWRRRQRRWEATNVVLSSEGLTP
jgi:WD40 repeat protein